MDNVSPPGQFFYLQTLPGQAWHMAVERDGLKRVFLSSSSAPFVRVWLAKVVNKFNFVTGFHKLPGEVGNAHRPGFQIVVDIVRMDH
jgi:hypothetical protein